MRTTRDLIPAMALALATGGRVHVDVGRAAYPVWTGRKRPMRPVGPVRPAEGLVYDPFMCCLVRHETAARLAEIRGAK